MGILLNELLNLVLKHIIREHRPLRSMLISIVVNTLVYSLDNFSMLVQHLLYLNLSQWSQCASGQLIV